MRKLRYFLFILFMLLPALLNGQSKLEGKVIDADDKDEPGLTGANVVST